MENNAVKRDNRKALPKYLLILFVAAIFGGVLGFAAGWMGHDNLSEVIVSAVSNGLIAAAPWALLATSGVSLAAILLGKLFAAAIREACSDFWGEEG